VGPLGRSRDDDVTAQLIVRSERSPKLGIVLFGFLAVPYVRLRFMARHERLRSVDLWLLGASGLVATHIVVLAVTAAAGTRS